MSRQIKKILIANRGEIALRVISTCRAMGIETVTVFTTPDEALPHAMLSDEAYNLGEGTLAETYLNAQKLIDIALKSGADAIHPGYGFLSENARFAEQVTQAGLIFIGPTPEVIRLMGDKITSRESVLKIGVPLIPGYNGEKQDLKTLHAEAEKIGVPVLIKASAGGGGKGMRVVSDLAQFEQALGEAKAEAQNAFGDARVFIEKYITEPRHIEVQVMSDTHGTHLHFYERECSIQRRHQKIVEESPSPALSDKIRSEICDTAVRIASAIGYVGAGTVEFILDRSGAFYFLEMNTRLQVEHPVTEMVTGSDLVRLQILVASGEKMPLAQSDIRQNGHAIEVRIYAEDPDRGFLPTTGRLEQIGALSLSGVRLENGYRDGNDISVHYDPMIAKLVAWGATRSEACGKLSAALTQLPFIGLRSNRDYLRRILAHPDFQKGDTFTDFVTRHASDLKSPALSAQQKALIVAAHLLSGQRAAVAPDSKSAPQSPWQSLGKFRNAS